ncbi:unnamed protein product [Candidula unifasciata]|uniref:PX domain-containing protein n=1 Tax=Candidula unifasciata TaxID=100452 RepID=A0A8S3ZPE7_9EUPU|nr:unnamed protein product [Candidula unifasciata]
MNTILSKLRGNSVKSEEQAGQSAQNVQEESTLAEEQDSITGDISGMLTIYDESMKSPTDSAKDFPSYEVPCDGGYTTSNNVTFEVISAEVIRDGRSGHVNYTILINPHKEVPRSSQSVVIRRYSDFEHLHHQLRKKFPSLISRISFPRKVLTGNFTSETIAKRSVAFEQYLAHLFSFFEIRYSSEFMEFFVRDEFTIAVSFFLSKEFSNAASHFENTLPVLEKLYGDSHPHVFHCLCGLVVSYMSIDKLPTAHSCAEMALRCSGSADAELVTALILTTIRLCWSLGKDKQDLEKKLQTMSARGVSVHSVKDLHELLQGTFYLRSQNVTQRKDLLPENKYVT